MTFSSSTAPLVSVIMPVYNHERYVTEALLSIVGQDWRPLEIIVIDDGSKDGSFKKLQDAVATLPSDMQLVVHLKSRENRGAHNTINEGIEQAQGEYIAILNSDDYYLPGRIRRCVEAAVAHKSRFVFTYVDPIDDDGVPLSPEHRWRHWYADLKMQELDIAPNISNLLLRYNIGVSTGNFVFHRSLVDDIGLFKDYRYAHDLDFMLRASALEEPVLIRDKLYGYRIHASNTIGESDERITEEVAGIVESYLRQANEVPPVNPLAPRLDRDFYTLATTSWPPHLEKAVDRLMCDPALRSGIKPQDGRAPDLTPVPAQNSQTSHITLISHELSRTGAPVLLRDVASALHALNVATHVISLGSGPLADDYARMNSPVVTEDPVSHLLSQAGGFLMQLANDRRVPVLAKRPLALAARLSGGVGARLRMWRYRVKTSGKGPLLINSFASWPLALPLLQRWQGPAFWYIHETYEPSLVMRSGRHLARLRNLADEGRIVFLFGSDATRRKWAEEGYDGEVLYWSGLKHATGLDLVPKEHIADKRVILSVQSTGPRKGTRSLIEAFAIGCRQGLIPDDVVLHIVGAHAPSRNALSRDLLVRILQNDIRGRVQLIPNLAPEELDAHYAGATVYVQSSTMECLPLALLNAMACGLPIVSTDADGCREAILDGQTGLLIPPRQSQLMAEALADLINDQEKAATLARNARSLFEEKFAVEVTAPKLMHRIIGGSGQSS